MEKSSRHSKITGDFAEAIILYWLSKLGYESARLDHTGIDLIACTRDGSFRMGISVQGRSRPIGREKASIILHDPDGALKACKSFNLEPYTAIVVDAGQAIHGYLLSFDCLRRYATGDMKYFQLSDRYVDHYRADPNIKWFELSAKNWPSLNLPSKLAPEPEAAAKEVGAADPIAVV